MIIRILFHKRKKKEVITRPELDFSDHRYRSQQPDQRNRARTHACSSSRRQRLAPSLTTVSSAGEQLPLRGAPLDVDLQDADHDAKDDEEGDEADQDPRQGVHRNPRMDGG